jgi:hypothetical protein
MTTTVLNIIIGISAGLVTLIAFGEEIANSSRFKLAGKLWFKLVITIIALSIGIWASVMKDKISDREQNEKEAAFNERMQQTQEKAFKNQIYRDSINAEKLMQRDYVHEKKDSTLQEKYSHRLESSNTSNLKTYTKILAEYGLHVDSINNRLVKVIKDSNNKYAENPFFSLCVASLGETSPIVFRRDSVNKAILSIRFCSQKYPSFNMNVNCCIIALNHTNLTLLANMPILNREAALAADASRTVHFSLKNYQPSMDKLFIYLKGSYNNVDGKSYPYKGTIYVYDLITGTFKGIAAGGLEETVVNNYLKVNRLL